jgi:hypothetical protein
VTERETAVTVSERGDGHRADRNDQQQQERRDRCQDQQRSPGCAEAALQPLGSQANARRSRRVTGGRCGASKLARMTQ